MSSNDYHLKVISCENGTLENVKVTEVTDRQIKASARWEMQDFQIDESDMEELELESSPSSMELNIVLQFVDERKIPIEDACWFYYDKKHKIEEMRGEGSLIYVQLTLGSLKGNTKKVSINSLGSFQGFKCELLLSIPESLQTNRNFQMVFGDFYKYRW